jgi:hypothetical protein
MSRVSGLKVSIGAVAVLAGVLAAPVAASAVADRVPGKNLSPIASGYAAVPKTGGATAFRHVQASFAVPRAHCAVTPNAIAQQRAGIDGITDGTVERVGVSETCKAGSAKYAAWYQATSLARPKGQVLLFHPQPGDALLISVNFKAGVYHFLVADHTTGKTYTGAARCATVCHNSSAEVTAGSPRGLKPADFASVHFVGIVVKDSAGTLGGLANSKWTTLKLVQPGSPHTVALILHTFSGPPRSAFVDKWVP